MTVSCLQIHVIDWMHVPVHYSSPWQITCCMRVMVRAVTAAGGQREEAMRSKIKRKIVFSIEQRGLKGQYSHIIKTYLQIFLLQQNSLFENCWQGDLWVTTSKLKSNWIICIVLCINITVIFIGRYLKNPRTHTKNPSCVIHLDNWLLSEKSVWRGFFFYCWMIPLRQNKQHKEEEKGIIKAKEGVWGSESKTGGGVLIWGGALRRRLIGLKVNQSIILHRQ